MLLPSFASSWIMPGTLARWKRGQRPLPALLPLSPEQRQLLLRSRPRPPPLPRLRRPVPLRVQLLDQWSWTQAGASRRKPANIAKKMVFACTVVAKAILLPPAATRRNRRATLRPSPPPLRLPRPPFLLLPLPPLRPRPTLRLTACYAYETRTLPFGLVVTCGSWHMAGPWHRTGLARS